MALSKDFIEAVEQQKTTRVRIMLKDSLLLDPSCKEFDEMLAYANSNMDSLIEMHDGEQFIPSDEWDENYLNDEMVIVVRNFSIERIELLKRIVKKLYSGKEESAPRQNTDSAPVADDDANNTNSGSTKTAGGIFAAVGAGLVIGGLVISDVPIVVPIAGGIAIGIGAYLFLRD